ncbi:MAG: NCS1 family nucleobase:cation symporter-1 [Gemmatimonadota bacterium]|nr:NCS1 family nucleobase:cation symporter-1 [Gemmatimonadota bacterium]MDH3477490.1 NCS1 family nucleobase:cation symporter-1 [Gemmatimonadota bacterium]MDH5548708.1 NCS1 family nucleobase:cation symporter-1 [Gemmatimonadota bacterium]
MSQTGAGRAVPDSGADTLLINADLAPVAAEQRTWGTWNFAALWVAMAITIPTYTLASSLVERGWTWLAAMGSVVLGNLIVLFPIALNSHAGTRYGIPFPVLTRASFGVFGANVPALLRAIVACGWFGIQTWIGGWAIYKLLAALWPGIAVLPAVLPAWVGLGTGEFLCFMAFWALNVWVALRGMDSIKFLETWGAPFLLVVAGSLFVWAWVRVGGIGPMLESPAELTGTGAEVRAGIGAVFGAGLTSAVAFWGTMALSIPDFSRFARTQRDQIVGQAIGLPPTMAIFAFIGAAVTSATAVIFGTRIADPIELLSRIGGPVTVVIAMLGLAVATLTTNIAANVVAPANGFSNVAPHRVSFKTGVMITALIGILMFPWRLYNDAAAYIFTWLIGYGALLGPVAGIMIADYFVLRRGVLDLDGLYRRGGPYEYSRGVNWIAMAALLLGVAPNLPGFLAALGVVDGSPLTVGIYNWAWFVGFFLSGGLYLVGMRVLPTSGPAHGEVPHADT